MSRSLLGGLLFFLVGTLFARATDPNAFKAELIQADREFCREAAGSGARAAFLSKIAEDGLLLSLGQSPTGKDAVHQLYDGFPGGATLTWKPLRADVAASGDLGYTTGTYELRVPGKDGADARVSTGNYVTIWKRQADGSWKFVLDGGNPTPPKK